jgi:hypothetical protein
MSAWRMWQLSDGGPVIAHVLGARYVEPDEATRDAFLADLAAVVEADRRVTLREFVLLVSLDQAAFQKGAAVLGLGWHAPLERARYLSPFAKPALLKACVEAAAADGVFRLPEVEMVRMVAATLDCPVPPAIAA